MHVTPALVRASGVTDEQAAAFAKRFPRGATLTYQTLAQTGWRVDWLAALVEWPRRMAVYKAIDATCERFDIETKDARADWTANQRYFQRLTPPEERRFEKSAWIPYRQAKEASEAKYEAATAPAFDRMHAAQARAVADALSHVPPKWFPYAESETFDPLDLSEPEGASTSPLPL